MHVMITESLYDLAFVKAHTTGFHRWQSTTLHLSSGYPGWTQMCDSCPAVMRSRSTMSGESWSKGSRHRRRATRCGLDSRWMGRAQSPHVWGCGADRRRPHSISVVRGSVGLWRSGRSCSEIKVSNPWLAPQTKGRDSIRACNPRLTTVAERDECIWPISVVAV
jgi:hypothetical protein